MAKFGFEQGWSAGQQFIEGQRQRRRDKSDRKLSRAQRSVLKWEGKSAKKDYQTKKREDYWGAGRFKLSKSQKDQISKAEERDKERGWSKSDMAEAPKLLKQFEQDHEGSKGALAGQFIERQTSITKEGKASAKSKMAAASQDKARATQLEAVTEELGKSPDAYKRIAESQAAKGESDVASVVANTEKTKVDTEAVKLENSVFLENNKAKNAQGKAESEARVKEAEARLLKIQQEMAGTKATAEKVLKHNDALDDYSANVSEMIGRVSDSGNVLNDLRTIRQAIAKMPTSLSGSSVAAEAANSKRDALVAQLKVKEQELVSSKQFRIAKEKEANSVTAMSHINNNPKLKKLYEGLEDDPIAQSEIEIPFWVAERLTDAGIPLGVMNDDDFNNKVMRVEPHPDPKQRWFPDGKGGFLHDEKTGKLHVRTVMQEGNVMRNLDDFIGNWKAKRTPTPMVRDSLTTGGHPGQSGKIDIGLGSATPPPPRYQESMESSAAFREGKDIDFETYEKDTTGGEIDRVLHSLTNPEDDNLATAVRGMTEERRKELYADTDISKQWLDAHLDKPSTPETPLPYHSRSAAPTVSTPAATPAATPPAPTDGAKTPPPTDPDESELRSLSGINEEQAKALEKLGVNWKGSKLSGQDLIKNEISSASREVERIEGSIKEKSTTLKKGRAATKPSDLSGIGGTTSAVNLSPNQKVALRKEIERDEIELKAREKKLIELQRLLSPRDSRYKLPSYKGKKEAEPKPSRYRSPSANPNLNPNLMPKKRLKATDKSEG